LRTRDVVNFDNLMLVKCEPSQHGRIVADS
jgi:hypothetical protein